MLAHLCVDALTIPILCLCLWSRQLVRQLADGADRSQPLPVMPSKPAYLIELGPFKVRLEDHLGRQAISQRGARRIGWTCGRCAFGPALFVVGGLMFALSGATMWLSAAGRLSLARAGPGGPDRPGAISG